MLEGRSENERERDAFRRGIWGIVHSPISQEHQELWEYFKQKNDIFKLAFIKFTRVEIRMGRNKDVVKTEMTLKTNNADFEMDGSSKYEYMAIEWLLLIIALASQV